MEHQDDLPIFRVDVSDVWQPLPAGVLVELVTPPKHRSVYHIVRGQRRTVFRTTAALETYLGELV